jgi:hypothetical protein
MVGRLAERRIEHDCQIAAGRIELGGPVGAIAGVGAITVL